MKHLENATEKKIKTFLRNNGAEFMNHKFTRMRTDMGIKRVTTTPNCPQTNGSAERYNYTIMDILRAVMVDTGLLIKM
jgi:transposase InsO family protein